MKEEFKAHLEQTAEQIKNHDEWNNNNLAAVCQQELINLVEEHHLENDDQTGIFCKFVSLATNFATMTFVEKIQIIPNLVENLNDLLTAIRNEIKDFAQIANYFSELINAFVAILMETQHNMNLALPYLENSNEYLAVMSEAFQSSDASDKQLTPADLNDIKKSLEGLADGVSKLLEHSKSSKEKALQLDMRVDCLKNDIQSKIKITQNRITFEDSFAKVGSGIAINVGFNLGFSAASFILESSALGGSGVLLMGGMALVSF